MYNRFVRILLLNLYYPPDTSATAKMAETVARALAQEHQVTVLCGRPSYDPTERRPWRLWQTEHAGNVRIIRVGSTAFSRFNMKKRVLNYLTYVKLAVPIALFIPCDLVIAMTDPPFEGIVGAWIALLKFKRYLYNIRDMYPDMAVGGSIVKPGRMSRIWERLHRWALRRATKVVVLGEDMKARIAGKGVEASRIEIVRDGAEILPPGSPPPQLDPQVILAIRGEFRFVLLHAGNLGFYGAWDTLLAAAPQLAPDGIGIVFVGDGAERPRVESAAKNIPNVRLLPFFPASKIPSVLAAADVHIITVRNGLEGVVVPSKMYGILAAAKPILAVTPRACEPVILGESAGYTRWAPADNPDAVASAALELFQNPAHLHRMEEAAVAAAPAYDRVKELQKFAQIVASLNPANKK
jgi:glycosyltransferase involved in cell wall biosynthesis